MGAVGGQKIFWSPSLKGKAPSQGLLNIKYYLFSLSSLGTTVSIFLEEQDLKLIDTINYYKQHSFHANTFSNNS